VEPDAFDDVRRALHALREADEATLDACLASAQELAIGLAPPVAASPAHAPDRSAA